MLKYKAAVVSAAVAVALVAAPLSSASAHDRHHGGLIFGLGAAAVVGAATLLTLPIAIATAPFRGPAYYPPPGYYPPAPTPAYYAPPPGYYYAPPPGYYAPPPGYYAAPRYPQEYYGR
jgi:hypothetical protein